MKPVLLLYSLALPACFLCAPAQSQVTLRSTALRAEASASAKEVAPLTAGTMLAIIKRDGFWVQASAAGARGWLRMTELSFAQPGSTVNLTGVDSGRLGKSNIVASSAARGLSADELRQAKPDFTAVAALGSLSSKPELLHAFRLQGGLATVTLAPLRLHTAPTKPAEPTSTSTGAANEEW